jgi:hypothetical protein
VLLLVGRQFLGQDRRAQFTGVDAEGPRQLQDLHDLLDGGAVGEGALDVAADPWGVQVGAGCVDSGGHEFDQLGRKHARYRSAPMARNASSH